MPGPTGIAVVAGAVRFVPSLAEPLAVSVIEPVVVLYKLGKSATPFTAVTTVVPPSEPGPLARAAVTWPLKLVAIFPYVSSASTVNGNATPACTTPFALRVTASDWAKPAAHRDRV